MKQIRAWNPKWRTLRCVTFLALAAAMPTAAGGCNNAKPERPETEATRTVPVLQPGHGTGNHPHTMTTTSALTDAQRAEVIAKIGDETITLGQFEERLNNQPAYVRVRYNSLEKKKEFLDNLIQFELLAHEAKSKGYDKDPDVVSAMKQQMVKKLMEEDIAGLVSATDITTAEIEQYYRDNPTLYHKPEQVRVSQVVLATEAEAQTARNDLLKEIEANPRRKRQTFNDYVRRLSVDEVTKTTSGDVGFFDKEGNRDSADDKLPQPVVDAAFALESINDISNVVADGQQFRILMLTNRRPQIDKSLDEVKRQIHNKLYRERRDSAREQYIAKLRSAAQVQLHEEHLALIKNPEFRPPDLVPPGPDGTNEVPGLKEIQRMREKAEENGLIGDDTHESPEHPN
ncbi:MAG: peptidyl-prolyl cis-trans isomerase [Myxococcales bacterium]|nr:peptidyl-prolyl cis-trans isomerase [Myxococcales bacterium]